MEKILRVRNVDFTPPLWNHYRDKGTIIYEKDADGNKFPSMIHIHEVQRTDFVVKHHMAYLGNEGKQENKILDWTDSKRFDQV